MRVMVTTRLHIASSINKECFPEIKVINKWVRVGQADLNGFVACLTDLLTVMHR
jgi:hypothetical protein